MEFKLSFADDWQREETVQINTLEDLQSLAEEHNEKLVIDFRNGGSILIYNTWIE